FYQKENILTKKEDTKSITIQSNSNVKNYISIKIDSHKLSFIPLPKPKFEVFVYNKEFEAIHLRGGEIARGGIRWSDRIEDYRTEILGLMKAQMTKNTIIVPKGSKGGFIIKDNNKSNDRTHAINCYQNFLRGILDITDNINSDKNSNNNNIIKPNNVICYDQDDPYLVVAADKGTASFSDYANNVSLEYGFWLGDGFASGGGAGYDHKKMGITAKGAWVSAKMHFLRENINIEKQPISVVAIGDMSGDVFGNGMLLSKSIKLIAAFNHKHIFIDPYPKPLESFNERKRLFDLNSDGGWGSYNKDLLSKGGNIFSRNEKNIILSNEIKMLLSGKARNSLVANQTLNNETNKGITQKDSTDNNLNHEENIEIPNIVSPSDLIKLILKLDADLLWNGGIGTYVKSSKETNAEIGDKANDQLRVNGKELKFYSVAEGGNLGMSQLGRIEYSLKGIYSNPINIDKEIEENNSKKINTLYNNIIKSKGGRLNTDFIDNSAGVDCSDHEVNIKIILNKLLSNNSITKKNRDLLLAQMSDKIEKMVLKNNLNQNITLNILEQEKYNFEGIRRVIDELVTSELLDPEVEFLPSYQEIERRKLSNEYITRSELSVILSYSKMLIDQDLSKENIDLLNNKYFDQLLLDYFPYEMSSQFKEEILLHPLRKDIIRTIVTNKIINDIGSFKINSLKRETGASVCDIVRCYICVIDILNIDNLKEEYLTNPELSSTAKDYIANQIAKIICRSIRWVVSNIKHPMDINNNIIIYRNPVKMLTGYINVDVAGVGEYFNKSIERFNNHEVPKEISTALIKLSIVSSTLNIVDITYNSPYSIKSMVDIYFQIGEMLCLNWLRKSALDNLDASYWGKISIESIVDDLHNKQKKISFIFTKQYKDKEYKDNNSLKEWREKNKYRLKAYNDFINDIRKREVINLDILVLASKKLDIFITKIDIDK
ncbi:MAG TPA: NAD-glutamate dehydrogenase, partial [Candidatus Megaira endosymbiont of Hartmannula sinica]|nr:NAD-glutamate dehydrogenase [Candidatus Megaera endosymbiont of Hartmannula sinica]